MNRIPAVCILLLSTALAFGQCDSFTSACYVGRDLRPGETRPSTHAYLLEYATQDTPLGARQVVFEWFGSKAKAIEYLNKHPEVDFMGLVETSPVTVRELAEKPGKYALVKE